MISEFEPRIFRSLRTIYIKNQPFKSGETEDNLNEGWEIVDSKEYENKSSGEGLIPDTNIPFKYEDSKWVQIFDDDSYNIREECKLTIDEPEGSVKNNKKKIHIFHFRIQFQYNSTNMKAFLIRISYHRWQQLSECNSSDIPKTTGWNCCFSFIDDTIMKIIMDTPALQETIIPKESLIPVNFQQSHIGSSSISSSTGPKQPEKDFVDSGKSSSNVEKGKNQQSEEINFDLSKYLYRFSLTEGFYDSDTFQYGRGIYSDMKLQQFIFKVAADETVENILKKRRLIVQHWTQYNKFI